jgi:hypothetical protein
MRKTWVLDTETKGTGAHVAPLQGAGSAPARERQLDTVTLRRPARAATAPPPEGPPRFRIVDVMSARTIADGVDARAAVAALGRMRSLHDARAYIWVDASQRWRLLTLAEQRWLWSMRGAVRPERAPRLRASRRSSRARARTR